MIKNSLNQNINVFVKINDEAIRGAGKKDPVTGEYISSIGPGNHLEPDDYLNRNDITDFKFIVRFDRMPAKKKIEGICLNPGDGYGTLHLFEFVDKPDGTYEVSVHYVKDVSTRTHVDPEVHHPEG